ncbi:hypothetical protein FCR2A7T_19560 [Flavobacterium cauense R2A-7]|nr:hypothetical protein FCR2A7T_19560 [Flavobacterium cauense R2A-7]
MKRHLLKAKPLCIEKLFFSFAVILKNFSKVANISGTAGSDFVIYFP